MKDQMTTMTHVMDSRMRAVLIRAAKNIEKMISDGKYTQDTNMVSRTEIGLVIKIKVEFTIPNKPAIMHFEYSLDKEKFKSWADGMTLLKEGPMSFIMKGIQVVIPYGNEKLSSSGFTISHGNDQEEEIWLELWHQPKVTFIAHRDLFQEEEWIILLNA